MADTDQTLEEMAEDDIEMMGAAEDAPAEDEGEGENGTNLPEIEPDVPVKVTFLEYEAPNQLLALKYS
jgi:hypothetical protein